MDITGSRCGLEGAEAVLKLRVLRSNDDWDRYWHFHLAQERKRVHDARYLNRPPPPLQSLQKEPHPYRMA